MERASSSRILGSWVEAVSRMPMGKVKSVYRREHAKCDPDNNSQGASCVSEAAMCSSNCSRICSPSEFFPEIKGNLTEIVWAHAVNSQVELEKALSSGRSIGTAIDEARPEVSFVLRLLLSRDGETDTRRCFWLLSRVQIPPTLPGTAVSLRRYSTWL